MKKKVWMLLFVFMGVIAAFVYYNNSFKVVEENVQFKFFYVKWSCDSDKWWNMGKCKKYRLVEVLSSKNNYDFLLNRELDVEFLNDNLKSQLMNIDNTNEVYYVLEGSLKKQGKEFRLEVVNGNTIPFSGKVEGLSL